MSGFGDSDGGDGGNSSEAGSRRTSFCSLPFSRTLKWVSRVNCQRTLTGWYETVSSSHPVVSGLFSGHDLVRSRFVNMYIHPIQSLSNSWWVPCTGVMPFSSNSCTVFFFVSWFKKKNPSNQGCTWVLRWVFFPQDSWLWTISIKKEYVLYIYIYNPANASGGQPLFSHCFSIGTCGSTIHISRAWNVLLKPSPISNICSSSDDNAEQ